MIRFNNKKIIVSLYLKKISKNKYMNISTEETNSFQYYLPFIITLAITYIIVILLVDFIKNRNEEANKQNITLDYYALTDGRTQVIHDELTTEQRSLRTRFLLVSMSIKASFWVKAPYAYALYNRIHGFNRSDIGILIALEHFTSLVMSPLIGSLSDIYGRKKFCVIFVILIIAQTCLRITGDRFLAYITQICGGICSILIDTSFESWVIYEASLLFDDDALGEKQKNSFLRELFSKQVNLDCLLSILLTGVATFLYMRYDIFYPFYASVVFACISLGAILVLWNENNLSLLTKEKKQTFINKMLSAWNHIRGNNALLSLGIVECAFKISLGLFLFIWTPLLEETCNCLIHPGAIFTCFMIARLIGSELFSVSNILT
jgi:MFS family permease